MISLIGECINSIILETHRCDKSENRAAQKANVFISKQVSFREHKTIVTQSAHRFFSLPSCYFPGDGVS